MANSATTGWQLHESRRGLTKEEGRLQVEMDADVVVFDPKTIREVGTYEKPNQPAVGVQSVLVNGELVVAKGNLVLDARPGRPIRRTVQGK